MTPNPALSDAVDGAYTKFATYGRPTKLDASPLRDAKEILAVLTSAPLRDLTSEQIGPYAGWALTTVGSVDDYKHFLPRILEQAVRAPVWMGTMPQVIAARLRLAVWRNWPHAEQETVVTLFKEAWSQASHEHPEVSGDSASDWLCAVAALGEDVRPLLRQWLEAPSEGAVLQIANLATEIATITHPNTDKQIFWADVHGEVRLALAKWLVSNEVASLFEAARAADDEDRWSLGAVQEALQKHAGRAAN